MKKILYLLSIVSVFMSCDDFLDTENLTKKDSSNFPTTVQDAEMSLTGIYSTLHYNVVHENIYVVSEILSDDRFGGGGDNDRKPHAVNRMLKTDNNMFSNFWSYKYTSIYRANMALESLEMIEDWTSQSQKDIMKGEIQFLRAFSYFDLVRMFGTVPLVTTSEAVNNPRATPEELYAFIAQDLKDAISLLSPAKFGASDAPALGRATKWAAEALIARVFLFYTGYYQKNDMPLAGGGNVTKEDVISWLDDCINNSGHGLIGDFRNLWPYGNPYTAPDYPYTANNNIKWVGESGANIETIFAIKFGTAGDAGNRAFNAVGDMGLRAQPNYQDVFPYGQGWGIGPVTPNMVDDWKKKEPNDIRFKGSILDVDDPEEGINYTWGSDKQVEEAGFWQKKYIPFNHRKDNGGIENFTIPMFGVPTGLYFPWEAVCDWVQIRYADVLLMMTELKEDVSYINRVRSRSGLVPLSSYSLQELQDERRWELAFEGLRYYDLLRWHIADEALQKQDGVAVKHRGEDAVMNMSNIGQRVRDTGGFMPIPKSQIDLSDGVLEQTPGWEGDLLWSGY